LTCQGIPDGTAFVLRKKKGPGEVCRGHG